MRMMGADKTDSRPPLSPSAASSSLSQVKLFRAFTTREALQSPCRRSHPVGNYFVGLWRRVHQPERSGAGPCRKAGRCATIPARRRRGGRGRARGRGRSGAGCNRRSSRSRRGPRARSGRSRKRRNSSAPQSPTAAGGQTGRRRAGRRRATASASVRISTATSPVGPRNRAERSAAVAVGSALGGPAELAGEPGGEPDGQPGRGVAASGRDGLDRHRVDPAERLVVDRRVEELRDQLAPAGQAEPGGVAAEPADRRGRGRGGRRRGRRRGRGGRGSAGCTRRPGRGRPPRRRGGRSSTRARTAAPTPAAAGPRRGAGRRPPARRGARSARSRPGAGRARGGGRGPRSRPRANGRGRRSARARSSGSGAGSRPCRAPLRAAPRRPPGRTRRGSTARSA